MNTHDFNWRQFVAGMLVCAVPAVFLVLLAAVGIGRLDEFQAHLIMFVGSTILLFVLGVLFFGMAIILLLRRMLQQAVQGPLLQAAVKPEEREKSKDEFIAKFCHELRTPLTSILGFSALAKKHIQGHSSPAGCDDPGFAHIRTKVLKNLDIIEHSGWRLSRLVGDVQDLHRMESGRMPWHDARVAVPELVDEAVRACGEEFASKPDVCLKLFVADDLPCIQVDGDKIIQVLTKLLSCALRFTESGNVEVNVQVADEKMRVEVRDSGGGLAEDQLEKLFHCFHKFFPENGRTSTGDIGLGLAICKKIIERYKGRIWVESETGRGNSYIFTLPLSVAA